MAAFSDPGPSTLNHQPIPAEGAGVEPARGFRPHSVSNRCPAPIGRPFQEAESQGSRVESQRRRWRHLSFLALDSRLSTLDHFNASTRTRTQNLPLEAGDDFRFTIEARHGRFVIQRKARELNPHDQSVARFSKPARQTLSGYLP